MSAFAQFSVAEVSLGDDLPPGRQYLLTCPHGETGVTHLFGPAPSDEDMLALLRAKHEAEERCGCAASVTRKAARA
jgi:hypothetical protein